MTNRISYDDPRYRFIKAATEKFIQRDVDMIPTVLFEELAKHREDQEEVLRLVDDSSHVCPHCGEEVEEGDAILDGDGDATNKLIFHHWECDSCNRDDESEDVTHEELPHRGAVHGWPGAHCMCFWVTNSLIANKAAACGFLVYEPADFQGHILAIDGGGYDFHEAHWVPLYLALEFKWHEDEPGWEDAVIKAMIKLKPKAHI